MLTLTCTRDGTTTSKHYIEAQYALVFETNRPDCCLHPATGPLTIFGWQLQHQDAASSASLDPNSDPCLVLLTPTAAAAVVSSREDTAPLLGRRCSENYRHQDTAAAADVVADTAVDAATDFVGVED